jgi:hypothetical protein
LPKPPLKTAGQPTTAAPRPYSADPPPRCHPPADRPQIPRHRPPAGRLWPGSRPHRAGPEADRRPTKNPKLAAAKMALRRRSAALSTPFFDPSPLPKGNGSPSAPGASPMRFSGRVDPAILQSYSLAQPPPHGRKRSRSPRRPALAAEQAADRSVRCGRVLDEGRSAFGGQTGKLVLVLSFTVPDPDRSFTQLRSCKRQNHNSVAHALSAHFAIMRLPAISIFESWPIRNVTTPAMIGPAASTTRPSVVSPVASLIQPKA